MGEEDRPEGGEAPRVGAGTATVALLLGGLVALTVIGSSAVAVALPAVAGELGLGTGGAAWVLAAFSLPFAVATALFGRLADRFGMRTPLRVGVGLMAGGALLAAGAWSYPVLLAGRVVTGAGAGAVPVLVAGVVAARFSGQQRGRVLGKLTAVVGAVSGAGPLIGGGFTAVAGWRALVAVPALAVALGEPVARLAPAGGRVSGRLDVAGGVLVAVTVACGLLVLQAPSTGLGAEVVALLGAVTVAGGVAVALHTRRSPEGFLPHAVVGDRRVVSYCLAGLGLVAAYIAMLVALPLLLSDQYDWEVLTIGMALVPAAAVGAVAARLVGRIALRVGHHRVVVGLGLASAAGAGLAAPAAAVGAPVVMIAGLALASCGFAAGRVALIDAIAEVVDPAALGAALGVFNLAYFTGGAVGSVTVGAFGDLLGLPAVLGLLAVFPLGAAAAAAAARP